MLALPGSSWSQLNPRVAWISEHLQSGPGVDTSLLSHLIPCQPAPGSTSPSHTSPNRHLGSAGNQC